MARPASTSSESSDSSSGGAPLRSRSGSTSKPRMGRNVISRPLHERPMEDEMNLMQASRSFGSMENNPFTPAPKMAMSVAPVNDPYQPNTSYAIKSPYHQGRVGVGGVARPVGGGARNRQHSSGAESVMSNWNQNAVGLPFTHQSKPTWQKTATIQANLADLNHAIQLSAGANSDVAVKSQRVMQESMRMVNITINDLVRERDVARQAQADESTKLKRIVYDHEQAREHERNRMTRDLGAAGQNAKFLEGQVTRLREQLKGTQEQVATMATDSQRFREHHERVVRAYKEQDEVNYMKLRDLEAQIQKLGLGNHSMPFCQDISSSSASDNSMALVKVSDFSSPYPVNNIDGDPSSPNQFGALSKSASNNTIKYHSEDSSASRGSQFNPEAPAWKPASTTVTTANYEYRDGEPPRAPRYMRLAAEAASRIKTPASSSRSPVSRPVTPFFGQVPVDQAAGLGGASSSSSTSHPARRNTQESEGLSAHYADAFGINRPPTAMPQYRHNNNAQKTSLITYPTASDKPAGGEGAWAVARTKDSWDHDDIKAAIEHVYEITKGYVVRCHTDLSPRVPDRSLVIEEPKTWSYMVNLAYKDSSHGTAHMTFLLSEAHYRPYILQRMLVDYIFKKMFTPSIFLGYSAAMDSHLTALQEQIVAMGSLKLEYTDTRGRARQRVIEDHARLIRTILEKPDIQAFRRAVIDKHAHMLMMILQPLRSHKVDEGEATRLLKVLCGAVWEITTKIWTSGMTLHYYFPECSAKFSHGSMDALNARQLGRNIYQLQSSQYRVSFVVTPTLTLRDDTEPGYLKTYAIRKAEVLVMK